ncbi:MAG: hypothetical protein PHZ02_01475 [Desulfocapsaceae bacterium]|nr:hypothetical protein [Desulfocapsaceae bacterium]
MNQLKPTKERIEFENAKKNLRVLDLKARLSEKGIDTAKIPRIKLDEILRLMDKQYIIHDESQKKIKAIQDEAIQEANTLSAEGEKIVESLRNKYGTPCITMGEPAPLENKECNEVHPEGAEIKPEETA